MRIDELLSERTPKQRPPANLQDLYEWEESEDGQQALDDFYNPNKKYRHNETG